MFYVINQVKLLECTIFNNKIVFLFSLTWTVYFSSYSQLLSLWISMKPSISHNNRRFCEHFFLLYFYAFLKSSWLLRFCLSTLLQFYPSLMSYHLLKGWKQVKNLQIKKLKNNLFHTKIEMHNITLKKNLMTPWNP